MDRPAGTAAGSSLSKKEGEGCGRATNHFQFLVGFSRIRLDSVAGPAWNWGLSIVTNPIFTTELGLRVAIVMFGDGSDRARPARHPSERTFARRPPFCGGRTQGVRKSYILIRKS